MYNYELLIDCNHIFNTSSQLEILKPSNSEEFKSPNDQTVRNFPNSSYLPSSQPPSHNNWWKHLVAGAMAGIVSQTCTAPLDRLKIFKQVLIRNYLWRKTKHFILLSFNVKINSIYL